MIVEGLLIEKLPSLFTVDHSLEISSGCLLEGLMLKLKLQYFGVSEELTHLKRLWCWERLRAGGEGDDRGWDGWMASPTQWTWVWVDSSSWWWTERPGMLRFIGSQRVGHDWVTELNWFFCIGIVQYDHFIRFCFLFSFYEVCTFSVLSSWLFRYILHFMVEYSFHNLLTH